MIEFSRNEPSANGNRHRVAVVKKSLAQSTWGTWIMSRAWMVNKKENHSVGHIKWDL